MSSKPPLADRKGNYAWTKENILKLTTLWNQKNLEEIAEEMDLEPKQVQYMAHVLRAKGVKIPKKRKTKIFQILIDELFLEHPELKA